MSDPTPGTTPRSQPAESSEREPATGPEPGREASEVATGPPHRDLLDAELEAEIEGKPAGSGGAMVPVSPVQRGPGLWRRLKTTRAGQRARSFVEATSNEPVLARLDEIREQLYTRLEQIETRLDRLEGAGQPSAQRLDEIAAELRTRVDRLENPNQAILAVLDAQKSQLESAAGHTQAMGERLERLEARVEEVWEVEEQLAQLSELRERVESLATRQKTDAETLASIRTAARIAAGFGVLLAVGLAALGYRLLAA